MNPNAIEAFGQVDEGPADLTDAEVNAAYNQIGTAAGNAVWLMGDKAQAQWRGGACVEIRATEQSRDVRKNETVQFEAQVFHKIEGVELHKPIVNDFSGVKSVDPVDIPVPAPVTISYKAGPMADDMGTITMTTTSNRGIGTLSLTFRVKGGWVIDHPSGGGRVKGQKCGDPDGEWIINGTYNLAGFKGDQKWTITIKPDRATGTFLYSTLQEGQPGGSPLVIYLVGFSAGVVTLSIDPSSGVAHMHLKEKKHTYSATTQAGGSGKDLNAPLESYDFDWDVGGTC